MYAHLALLEKEPVFAVAVTCENQTPESSAFECRMVPVVLQRAFRPFASGLGCIIGFSLSLSEASGFLD